MKSQSVLFSLLMIGVLLLAACGGAAPATEAPAAREAPAFGIEESQANQTTVDQALEGEAFAPPVSDALAAPAPTNAAYEITNASGDLTVVERANRMIVKNGDIRLMVEDTDVAIDRSMQIVGDAGGYIVSSRVWYQDYYGNSLKYASVTIGVPVDEFENVLRRLRGLAVQVMDETATGDDVTE